MPRSSKLLLLPLMLVLAAALVSCNESKENESAENNTSGTMSSTTTNPSAQPVQVVAVDLGRTIGTDKQVTERVETFKPNDTIYASIHTTGSAPTSKMSVKWTDPNGQVVDQSEQPIVTAEGSNAMEFHLAKPGLPAGTYKVEVFVDGNSVQSKEFHVSS
jgi:ABC-type Fe3+-hydroxamate transport system substrate-binding protein